MKHIRNYVLIALLGMGILFCGLMFLYITNISLYMAEWNPKLAYMRLPILLLTYVVIASIIGALIIGLRLVIRSTGNNIFESMTVKALYYMGHLFSAATVFVIAIFLYSYSQIQMEIGLVGGELIIVGLILFAGANVMYFIADLFQKAVEYKEENDLVI